jgi:hypothetical protein
MARRDVDDQLADFTARDHLMRRSKGATLAELMELTRWQANRARIYQRDVD